MSKELRLPGRCCYALCFAALLSTVACGGHRIAHKALDDPRPHVTWEIRAGGTEEDAHFICGSADPFRSCILDASTERKQTGVTVHLYLHAVALPTSYLGFMRAEFLTGQQNRQTEVNVTVPPESRSVTVTTSGTVASNKGPYAFTISLEALQPGMTASQRIAPRITVIVR